MCCGCNTTFCTCLFLVWTKNCSWVFLGFGCVGNVLQKCAAKNQTNRLLNPHNFNTNY